MATKRMNQEQMDIQLSIVASRVVFPTKHKLVDAQPSRRLEHEDTNLVPPLVNETMGAICFPSTSAGYDDGGTLLLQHVGDEEGTPVSIKGYGYHTGRTSGNVYPNWKIELDTPGAFDIYSTYYTLSAYRSNFEVEIQDADGNKIGTFRHTKNTNTWSRGNYSTFAFRDAAGTLLIDFNSGLFAGTSYGNGRIGASIDMRDPSKIRFLPNTYSSNSHSFYVDRESAVNHPFAEAKFLKLTWYYQYSYYSNSNTHFKIASYNNLHKIAGRS